MENILSILEYKIDESMINIFYPIYIYKYKHIPVHQY